MTCECGHCVGMDAVWKKLCPAGKAAAKRKFKVYPSAYANGWAVQYCRGKFRGKKKNDKMHLPQYVSGKELESLVQGEVGGRVADRQRWEAPPCGRSKAKLSGKGYPKCRPSIKVSSKTPKTSGSMSSGQKRAATRRKRAKKQGVGGKPTIVKMVAVI